MKRFLAIITLAFGVFMGGAASIPSYTMAAISSDVTDEYINEVVQSKYPGAVVYAVSEKYDSSFSNIIAIEARFHNDSVSGTMVFDPKDGHIISEEVENH